MEQKTAVEWLIQQLTERYVSDITPEEWFGMKGQAKALEREQMRLIYEGILQNFGTNIKKSDLPTFNEYYEQTYGE